MAARVAAAAAVSVGVLLYAVLSRKKTTATSPPSPPSKEAIKKTGVVLVLGAGTIGSSFTSVFLARGLKVINVDPWVTRETLEKRVREYWLVVKARGITKLDAPPFASSLETFGKLDEALQSNSISFVQECVYEEVETKQKILAELDRLMNPSTVISSSTSFIPWDLLVQNCQHKHRLVIGHPAIPHTHSFMEVYGRYPEWAQYSKEWYAKVGGFDVILLNKTIPGHVFNSFVTVNMDHATKLVREGVCSVEDVNTAMRHMGRDMYGRNAMKAMYTMIGGDRGFKGGQELLDRIKNDAIFLVLFSSLKLKGFPDFVAQPIGKYLGRFIASTLPDLPPEWVDACRDYEDLITKGGTIPPQTAYFEATKELYARIPHEPRNDPFSLPPKRVS